MKFENSSVIELRYITVKCYKHSMQRHPKTLSCSSIVFVFLNYHFFSCSGIEIATAFATSLPSSSATYFIMNSIDLTNQLSALDKKVFITNSNI